jgi:hypothetical protein
MIEEVTWLQALAIHLHIVVLAVTAAGICWAAMLAGLCRVHWFWRIAVLCLPLLMLLPIRAYEPLVMFFPLMLSLQVAAALLRKRWEAELGIVHQPAPAKVVHDPQPAKSARVTWFRLPRWTFSLSDFMLATTSVAVVMAVLVQLPWSNLNFSWGGLLFDATQLVALSLVILTLVGLRGGLGWALALFALVSLGIVFQASLGDGVKALYLMGVAGPQHLTWTPLAEFYLLFTTMVLIGLSLVRWCWQALSQPALFQQRRRWVGSAIGVAASPVVVMYMAMFVGPPAIPAPQIHNNVLPQLVELGDAVETMGLGDLTTREIRTRYPGTNYDVQIEATYATALQLVKQPGCVCLDAERRYAEDSLDQQANQVTVLRALARRWSREAEFAFRSGDIRRAVDFDLAVLRLGNHLSRGGIGIHVQAATVIKAAGLSHLAQLREFLPADLLPSVIEVLGALDLAAEDPQITNARDRYWTDISHGWRHRLESVVQRGLCLPSTETATYHTLIHPLKREAAQRRLLVTDLAIRRFQLAQNKYPATLTDLVPHLLVVLPKDPFTQKPLIYRPHQYSFTLYSTGPDAQDDGGKFPRFAGEAYHHLGIDWSVESVLRPSWRGPGRGWGPGFSPGGNRGPRGWTAPPWQATSRVPARLPAQSEAVTSDASDAVPVEKVRTTKATTQPSKTMDVAYLDASAAAEVLSVTGSTSNASPTAVTPLRRVWNRRTDRW